MVLRKCSHYLVMAFVQVRRRMPSGSAVRRWERIGTYCRECKRFYADRVVLGRFSIYINTTDSKQKRLCVGVAVGYGFVVDAPKALPGERVPLQRCNNVPKKFRAPVDIKPLPIYCDRCSSRMVKVKGQEPYCINRYCVNFRKVGQ